MNKRDTVWIISGATPESFTVAYAFHHHDEWWLTEREAWEAIAKRARDKRDQLTSDANEQDRLAEDAARSALRCAARP